jgi:hypothetical protein
MELDSSELRAVSNSGRDLERLVAEIERSLLPSGFEVVLNKTEFDHAGDQVAEFDIVISGRLGSSVVNWLIECRDRPSQGPAPGSWLEQLAGRKRRFKFDKVIATIGLVAHLFSALPPGLVLTLSTSLVGPTDVLIVRLG